MARTREVSDNQILDSARALFLAHGFSASTIAIAQKAGVSEALLFKRFGSKERLFAYALGTCEPPSFLDRMGELEAIEDPKAALRALLRWVLGYFSKVMPQLVALQSRGYAYDSGLPGDSNPRDISKQLIEWIARYLEREVARGRMRSPDRWFAARIILGTISNHVFFTTTGQEGMAMEAEPFIEGFAALLWEGMAPPPLRSK